MGLTSSEHAERAYERRIEEADDQEELSLYIALAESMLTVIFEEATRAAAKEAAVARHQEELDRALAESMKMVVTDEAARAVAEEAAAALQQEDLDLAILDSMHG